MSVNVVNLGKNNLSDIPGMLRKIADMIDSGDEDYQHIVTFVMITRSDDDIKVSAVGPQSDYYYTLATLSLAQHDLMR